MGRHLTPHHFVNLHGGGISSKKGFIASCRLHMIDSIQWSLCIERQTHALLWANCICIKQNMMPGLPEPGILSHEDKVPVNSWWV